MDKNLVIQQAGKLSDMSADLDAEILKLENLYSRIGTQWQGPASDTFRKQLLQLITDMKRTKDSISRTSNAIRDVANGAGNGGGAW